LRTVFDIDKKRKELEKVKKKVKDPNLWDDQERAVKLNKKFSDLKEEIDSFEELELEIKCLDQNSDLKKINKLLKEKEKELYFSGKYDKGNAILSIYSGAGGQDAQDWATMLLRMYQRYCQERGFKVQILEHSFGEGSGTTGRVGTKSVTLKINGKFAYGILKNEQGVHRVVRISPFSAQDLRHTSFALVNVLPEIKDLSKENINLKEEDLEVDTFKASGPGGQYVNKTESAVRVKHKPTNIVATCQTERSQLKNKTRAMEVLAARLYDYYEKKKKKEISEIQGDKISASWGNQVRNYVFHPYQLVKDLRTGVETSQIENVLDGDLEEFIKEEIKLKDD
jgi:peptide chain release factor 2